MKRCIFFLLLAFPAFAIAQNKCDRTVLETEQRRFNLMVAGDTTALRAMIADDLVYVHSNAMTENKNEHISAISTGRLTYHSMNREKVVVRRYGKTALTNGVVHVKVTLNGKDFELPLAYTAVYRKKKGKWLLVNWQSTKVP